MPKRPFIPTLEQDTQRNLILHEFNKPFPPLRHTIYRGALWAGVLMFHSGEEEARVEVMRKVITKTMLGHAAGYSGIYSYEPSSPVLGLSVEEVAEVLS